jgi:hypothetical protein
LDVQTIQRNHKEDHKEFLDFTVNVQSNFASMQENFHAMHANFDKLFATHPREQGNHHSPNHLDAPQKQQATALP